MTRSGIRETLFLPALIWATYVLIETWIAPKIFILILAWGTHGLLLMLLMRVVLDRAFVLPPPVRLGVFTAAPVIFALAQTAVDSLATALLGDRAPAIPTPPGMLLSPVGVAFDLAFKLSFRLYLWIFGFYTVVMVLLSTVRGAYESRLRAQRSEIEALRLQVNPHFLFNALTGMDSLLALKRSDQAREMLHGLSAFYRSTLMDRDDALILLEDELGALHDYAEVERIRFGDRLELLLDLPDDTGGTLVPPMILQPLVENALKHGDPGGAPIMVRLAVRLQGDQVEIDIRNPLVSGAPAPGTGTGLANVKARLRALYGDRAGLEAGPHGGEWRTRAWMPRQPDSRSQATPPIGLVT